MHMGQSRAHLLTMFQNIEKSLVVFSKGNDLSWVTLWLSFLSGVNRRASLMTIVNSTKTVYLVSTFDLHGLFSAVSQHEHETKCY